MWRRARTRLPRAATPLPISTSVECQQHLTFLAPVADDGSVWYRHGQPIVHLDPAAERKLRDKIDLMVVPTVSLLYLFCFIDRANIGNAKIAVSL